jgi:hypothetical protein
MEKHKYYKMNVYIMQQASGSPICPRIGFILLEFLSSFLQQKNSVILEQCGSSNVVDKMEVKLSLQGNEITMARDEEMNPKSLYS